MGEEVSLSATIQTATAGASGSPTLLTRDGSWTIVAISATPTDNEVQLPSGTQVGDIFELYISNYGSGNTPNLAVEAQSGETFIYSGSGSMSVGGQQGIFLRKLTSSLWGLQE